MAIREYDGMYGSGRLDSSVRRTMEGKADSSPSSLLDTPATDTPVTGAGGCDEMPVWAYRVIEYFKKNDKYLIHADEEDDSAG